MNLHKAETWQAETPKLTQLSTYRTAGQAAQRRVNTQGEAASEVARGLPVLSPVLLEFHF